MPLGIYRPRSYRKELSDLRYWRDILVEFFLAFIFVYMVSSSFLPMGDGPRGAPLIRGAVKSGFLVVVFIDCFGNFGGAHFHPTISMVFLLTGRLEPLKAVLYWIAQTVGAVCGAGILYACSPADIRRELTPPNLHPGVSPLQGAVLEGLASCIFMMVIQGAVANHKRPSFPIGFTVTALLMAIGEHTGGGLNPVVVFAPAVITGKWDNHWVYWVGPFTGGFLGVLLYNFFACDLGPCCGKWSPISEEDEDEAESVRMKSKNELSGNNA